MAAAYLLVQAASLPVSASEGDPTDEAVLADVPFLEAGEPNRIYVDLAPEGSARPLRLMLDTGATHTVLTPGAAEALGVRVRRTKSTPYRRKTMLGRDLQFYIDTSSSDTGSRTGWDYGLLGGNFLADYVIELDFPERRVRFLDRKKYRVPETLDSLTEAVLPLKIVSKRPGMKVAINGVDHLVLLDTGAPFPLVVSGAVAEKSSLASSVVPGFQIAGVRGDMVTEVGEAKRVAFGPFHFEGLPTVVLPKRWFNQGFPSDSVVGYDLLAQFVVRIDYPRERIWLRRRPKRVETWYGEEWTDVEERTSGAGSPGPKGARTSVRRFEGRLAEIRAEDDTLVVRKGGERFEFRFGLEGEVLDTERTSVKARSGRRMKLTELRDDAPLLIYWVGDDHHPSERFARVVQVLR